MVEKNIGADYNTLYFYKAGIQSGSELYSIEETENGRLFRCYTEYSSPQGIVKQNCQLTMDPDFDTVDLKVDHESKLVDQKYSFTVDNSEAHFVVEQKSKTPKWKGKDVDQIVMWENKSLVIPSVCSWSPFIFFCKKYSFEQKGIQNIACGVVPKVIFSMEYLGEDILEVGADKKKCRRFKITSSTGGTVGDFWLNEEEDIFKFLLSQEMIMAQSFRLE